MAKTCDLCKKETGWRSFRCVDGVLCKDCYSLVSNQFTSTITSCTLEELKKRYEKNVASIPLGSDGFSVTKKIGQYLLIDEQRKKFCIPSNKYITKRVLRPEIYQYSQLEGYQLLSEPNFPAEQLATLAGKQQECVVINRLLIKLRLKDVGIKEIIIIPSPVRTTSFAFRRSYKFAKEIMKELQHLD
ncbi:MAG: hypothetical protein ACRCW1_01550 [Anaerotignaceae bacterium]